MIEAVANPGKEGFRLTGKMGEVMQESANLAYTFVRHIAPRFGIGQDYFEKNLIHLHIPAGATPKDGPSAGITMASTLLSLATGRKIRKGLAMTGELSLVGHVLPIGGLKGKNDSRAEGKNQGDHHSEAEREGPRRDPRPREKGNHLLPG